MSKRKVTHGGKRRGAGRKPGKTAPWLVRVRPDTRENLKAAALAAGHKTPGALLDAEYGDR